MSPLVSCLALVDRATNYRIAWVFEAQTPAWAMIRLLLRRRLLSARRLPLSSSPFCPCAVAPSVLVRSVHRKSDGSEESGFSARAVGRALGRAAGGLLDLALHPSKVPQLLRHAWKVTREVAEHYWLGSKLLWQEMKLASAIIGRLLQGHAMSRRERNQLMRTTMDMFRLVPFAIFVIVPFMELLLPLALRFFPNMLPSTFTDELQREESMKKELHMRLAIAGFFQETMHALAAEKARKLKLDEETGAAEIISFIERLRLGEKLPNQLVLRMAQLFQDELTLDNVARPQLVSLCRYMGLAPYGADAFLRFQLRTKLRAIKEDDRRILWEGLDSLTPYEVREACQERGMSAFGLTDFQYKRQLREWLDLSIQKSVPISLLIMSRAFTLHEPGEVPSGDQLRHSLSSMDETVINEVVLAAARDGEHQSLDMKARRLESLQFQREKIMEERELKDAAATPRLPAVSESKEYSSPSLAEGGVETSNLSPQSIPTLSFSEVQALSDAAGGPIEREKSELHELRSRFERSGETLPSGEVDSSDPEIRRMRSALNSMLEKLTARISSAEAIVGDRLRLLDIDLDGELSVLELKIAIATILKRAKSDAEAEEFARLLDRDRDGKVSVAELRAFVEARKEMYEVHRNNSRVY